jgi:peptidyl-tRNA hydrolase
MKLYIVVRNDLAPGLQLAQAVHAKELFSHEHPEVNTDWYERSNNIVVLQVENKEELAKIAYGLSKQGLAVCMFKEPDLNDELTAIAAEPGAGTSLSSLPLALRQAA